MYIEAEFYTYDHVVRGFIDTPQERLSDFLNIKTETAIVIRDAQVSRLLGMGKTPPTELSEARIEKHSILFAFPAQQDMTQKSLYRRANRLVYLVDVLLPNFLLTGYVYLTEKFEIRRVLLSRPEDFIPLTDVTATYSLYPSVSIKKGIIVFNKTLMVMIGHQPGQESPLNPPTQPRPN